MSNDKTRKIKLFQTTHAHTYTSKRNTTMSKDQFICISQHVIFTNSMLQHSENTRRHSFYYIKHHHYTHDYTVTLTTGAYFTNAVKSS